jgi:hypothetical protein
MYKCVSNVYIGYAEQVTYYHFVHISHYELYPTVYFKIAHIVKSVHTPFLLIYL